MVARALFTLVVLVNFSAQAADTVTLAVDTGPLAGIQPAGEALAWNRLNLVEVDQMRTPGYPMLVLLPPDTSAILSVAAVHKGCKPAKWTPVPVGQLVSLSDGKPVSGTATSGPAAGAFIQRPATTEADAVMLPLILLPLTSGKDDRTEFCSLMEVTVTFERDGRPAPERGHTVLKRLSTQVANPDGFVKWYKVRADGDPVHDYVIVARQSFADASVNLGAFVDWKKEQGFSPHVVTIEEIEQEIEGEMMVQERLRLWLQTYYKDWGMRYVLLIGSPDPEAEDGIPMKVCYPTLGFVDSLDPALPKPNVPTDMYYADLTGNWNPDNDAYACELEDYMVIPDIPEVDGVRLDGVDLTPEVLVGRIPHHGKLPYFGDGVLLRTMNYAQMGVGKWHNRALLASPMVTFPDGNYVDGSLVADYLAQKSFKPSGYSYDILGEWEGNLVSSVPGVGPVDAESFIDFWNKGYGAVMWCAHGNSDGAYRDIWYQDANGDGMPQQSEVDEPQFVHIDFYKVIGEKLLSGKMPPVVFHGSCLNAEPEVHGNLAHTMLRHSSIANVASTRITMGLASGPNKWEPSPFSPGAFTMGVYFIHGVMVERRSVADAFLLSQNALLFGIQPWTFKVRLEFNLYGDPSTVLPACMSDDVCDDGDICNGTEKCLDGKCKAGAFLDCSVENDPGPCWDATCVDGEGCAVVQKLDHAPCVSDDLCMQASYCWVGECIGGVPIWCPPAGVPCYESICNPGNGQCLAQVEEDGAYCSVGMKSGECTAGECIVPVVDPPLPEQVEPQPDVAAEADAGSVVEPDQSGSSGCSASGSGLTAFPQDGLLFAVLMVLLWLLRTCKHCDRISPVLIFMRVRGNGAEPWTRNCTRNC